VAILKLMRHSTGSQWSCLGDEEMKSQVADLELQILRAHSAHVEDELSA